MARYVRQAVLAATRKTLREWIEADDGDTTASALPASSARAQALHAQIALNRHDGSNEARQTLTPPSALRLPPLG